MHTRWGNDRGLAGTLALALLLTLAACGGGGDGGPAPTPPAADTTAPVTAANPGGGTYGVTRTVTLTASEAATVYYSTDGSDPSVGGPNTSSGPSPLTNINIGGGTTVLKFFAVDTAGNRETPIKTETYVVDLVSPTLSLTGPAPGLFGLLTTQDITWQSNEAGAYAVELGGTGTLGSGTQLASGNVAANTSVPQKIRGSQLSFTSTTPLWIYVTDVVGHTGSTSVALSLKALVSIPLGGEIREVKLLPGGEKAYVARNGANTVAVVGTNPANPSFNTVLTNVPVGIHPDGIAITPDGGRVYVTNGGSTGGPTGDIDSISVINATSDTVTATTTFGTDTSPNGIAITPDGTRGYFLTFEEKIMVLDTNPLSPTFNLLIGNIPIPLLLGGNIAMTPDGTKAIVDWVGGLASAIQAIDVNTASPTYNQIIGSPVPVVAGGNSAGDVVISSDSSFAYASEISGTCWLCKIDLSTLAITIKNAGVPFAREIALAPNGSTLLTGDFNSQTLSVISAADLSPDGGVGLGGVIGDIAITPDGTRAYVVRNPVSLTSELVMVPLQ